MSRHLSACLLFCVLVSGRASSQEADTTYSLPGITIEDQRDPFYGNESAAFVTTIPSAELERSGRRTVAELLADQGGVFVRQYGPGGIGGVSLRGTGPSHTAVLLDGQSLENPQIAQLDLSLLPSFMLSEVEVLHGGASSLVGGGAVGGAISLKSLDVRSRTGARVSTLLGAWGERTVSGRVNLASDRVRGVIAGETFRQEGDFPYIDRASYPTVTRQRQNADVATRHLMGRLVVTGQQSTLEVAGWIMDADRGLPGLSGAGTAPDERQKDGMRRVWLRYMRGGTTLTMSSQRFDLTYLNPTMGINDRGRSATHSIGVVRSETLGRGLRVDAGADAAIGTASHPALGGGERQHTLRSFINGSIGLGRVTLMPSVRADWVGRDGASSGQVSPGLRVRADGLARGKVSVWSGISTSFRAPAFNDLYWQGAGATGSRELESERGFSADIGVDAIDGTSSFDAAIFYQSVRQQITWRLSEAGFWRPANVGRVRNVGLELSGSHRIATTRNLDLNLSTRYTLTDARDVTDGGTASFGKPLRYVPRHVLRAELSASWRALVVALTAGRTSRRYVTDDGTQWLPGYTVLGGRVSARLHTDSAWLDISLLVENLGESRYEIMSGYPMPPRHARLQLTLTTR